MSNGDFAGELRGTRKRSQLIDQSQSSSAVRGHDVAIAGPIHRPKPHPVFWMIAGALLALVAMQALRLGETRLFDAAFAQPTAASGARGIFAFTGQLSKSEYGLFMVDVDAMTIWAYEYQPHKSCLRLAAARTWRYDRYLENYNSCDLPPDAVEQMIDLQRQDRLQKNESEMP